MLLSPLNQRRCYSAICEQYDMINLSRQETTTATATARATEEIGRWIYYAGGAATLPKVEHTNTTT